MKVIKGTPNDKKGDLAGTVTVRMNHAEERSIRDFLEGDPNWFTAKDLLTAILDKLDRWPL